MTKVYCLTEKDDNQLFMNLTSMSEWLNARNPIGKKFRTLDGIVHDITTENLSTVLEESKKTGICPVIRIIQDFGITTVTTDYTISVLKAHD